MRHILPLLAGTAILAFAVPALAAHARATVKAAPTHAMAKAVTPAPVLVKAVPTPGVVKASVPGPVTVKIGNFTFEAPEVTVAPGTTITWVNDDDIPHTIVADDKKAFRSKVLDTGDRFSFTFTTPGTYGYFCSIHPHMTGKVVVKTS